MMCAWNEFLSILPIWLRNEVDKLGKNTLNELRLRINSPPELILGRNNIWLSKKITSDDLNYVINASSRYSPWTTSISEGYITAPGGHRIGIGGEYFMIGNRVEGIRKITSLCIRIARDLPGIACALSKERASVLILGAPGWGKTTLLRDLIRCFSENESVCVIDERGELFPEGITRGKKTDVLCGIPKGIGIEMGLRTLGPSCIAVDEITAQTDCLALVQASNCGVRLTATAHAASLSDFYKRVVYRPLVENRVFDTVVVMQPDRSYQLERMLQ